MKNIFLISAITLASFASTGVAHACSLHGAGYGGYGMQNMPWQAYNPRLSTMDPSWMDHSLMEGEQIGSLLKDVVPPARAKPSFSNAATMASSKAKARWAEKSYAPKDGKENVQVTKASLDLNR